MTTTTITTKSTVARRRSSSSRRRDNARDLTGVLDQLRASAAGCDRVSVEHVVDTFSERVTGPLLVIPALLLISPLGAVPFLPAVLAVFIILVAAQRLVARGKPWVPGWLGRQSVEREKLDTAIDWLQPVTKWVDRLIKPRLTVMVSGPAERAMAVAAVLMALLVFPLAPVPFAVQLPAWGLVMLGLAMIARDGLLAALGLALAAASAAVTLWVVL